MAALMTLPYGQRAAVVLRYWMDMTETEAAAALGCSVGNVKSQASRAIAKLRPPAWPSSSASAWRCPASSGRSARSPRRRPTTG
jgi:hypothetical protein